MGVTWNVIVKLQGVAGEMARNGEDVREKELKVNGWMQEGMD